METYMIRWNDTYHGEKYRSEIKANSLKEAIGKLKEKVALGGIGTANAMIVSVSPNDGYISFYGKLSEVEKKYFKDSAEEAVKDSLSESDEEIINEAIYWVKRSTKPLTIKNIMAQLEKDISGFIGNNERDVREYLVKKGYKDSMTKDAKMINVKLLKQQSFNNEVISLIKGKFEGESSDVWVVTSHYKGGSEFDNGGSYSFSERSANKDFYQQTLITKLQEKYGKQEGTQRYLRGFTDSMKNYKITCDSCTFNVKADSVEIAMKIVSELLKKDSNG